MGRGDDLEAAGEEFEEGGAMVEAGSAVKEEHWRPGAAMEDLELNVSDGESALADCAHAHRRTSVSSPWSDFKRQPGRIRMAGILFGPPVLKGHAPLQVRNRLLRSHPHIERRRS